MINIPVVREVPKGLMQISCLFEMNISFQEHIVADADGQFGRVLYAIVEKITLEIRKESVLGKEDQEVGFHESVSAICESIFYVLIFVQTDGTARPVRV